MKQIVIVRVDEDRYKVMIFSGSGVQLSSYFTIIEVEENVVKYLARLEKTLDV